MNEFNEMDLKDWGISHKEMDNQLLEQFGFLHIEDAIRIIRTGIFTPADSEVIHEVMCIVLSIYSRKVRAGEINQNLSLH